MILRSPLRWSVAALLWAGLGTIAPLAATAQGVSVPAQPAVSRRDDNAVLDRTFAAHLERVPLSEALAVVSTKASVHFTYSRGKVPLDKVVTLVAGTITVRDALAIILLDTGLEAVAAPSGAIRLEPRAGGSAAQQAGGTVAGSIVDSATQASIPQTTVRVDETGQVTRSDGNGKYAIGGVAAGQYHVTARRVGYVARTRSVVVEDGQTATVNFALNPPATRLEEVVTTAVGDMRRFEVGTDISTINVDSIAPTAPVTSLTDLISARAPGVEVLEASGMTGSGEAIRIRGRSSLILQNDPILIVDGVRQDNTPGGDVGIIGSGEHPSPSRLNDIDFSDIEAIDILKGPSASTEYGTDAANGVIVIKTKHGASGRPQWRASAERTASDMPVRFSDDYYGWGHSTDGNHTPVNCTLQPGLSPFSVAAGTCAVDSVTRWNPLNHAATSIFGTGSRQKYDLSVTGGSDAVRYYASGGLSNEAGLTRMPLVFRTLADTARLGLPNAALGPNSEQQRSVRTNTAIRLGPTADVTASGSYLSTFQQTPNAGFLYYGAFLSPALSDPAHYYGYLGVLGAGYTPVVSLSQIGSENTERLTGALNGDWHPADWFVGHAATGLDHGSQAISTLNYPLADPAFQNPGVGPGLTVANGTTDVYSADLRGTATAFVGHGVRATTSGGLQLVDTRVVGQTATSSDITRTNLTLNGATAPTVTQQADRRATLGGYSEEELGFADRLFVTGALRVDAASGFGRSYATAAYPKASISWLAYRHGGTTVRVRGAFGEAGVQPANGAALTLFAPTSVYRGGAFVPAFQNQSPGNVHLRPERSTELEGGFDVGAWGNRVSFELTGYSKTTRDALVNVDFGGDLCCYLYQENIGQVRNSGIEGSATATLIQGQAVTWDVGVNASVNHNKLISLAPGIQAQTIPVFPGQLRQTPGYPLYGIWAQRLKYADTNHDGLIQPNEVTLADSASFIGSTIPTQEASVATHLQFWHGVLTVGGLADYRGGYRITNAVAYEGDFIGNQRAENDSKTPLWIQARAVAASQGALDALYVEDGTFLRLREVSVTYALPGRVVRLLHAQVLSLTGAVRNLALWTRYTGADPEVSNAQGSNFQSVPSSNGIVVNNDVRQDFGTVPLVRYWVVRLNVAL